MIHATKHETRDMKIPDLSPTRQRTHILYASHVVYLGRDGTSTGGY